MTYALLDGFTCLAVIELSPDHCEISDLDVLANDLLGLGINVRDHETHVPLLARAIACVSLVPAAHLMPFVRPEHGVKVGPHLMTVVVPVHARHVHVPALREVVGEEAVVVDLVVLADLVLDVDLSKGTQVSFRDVVDLESVKTQQATNRHPVQVRQNRLECRGLVTQVAQQAELVVALKVVELPVIDVADFCAEVVVCLDATNWPHSRGSTPYLPNSGRSMPSPATMKLSGWMRLIAPTRTRRKNGSMSSS